MLGDEIAGPSEILSEPAPRNWDGGDPEPYCERKCCGRIGDNLAANYGRAKRNCGLQFYVRAICHLVG